MAFRRLITASEFHVFLGCSCGISAFNYYAYRNKMAQLETMQVSESVKSYARTRSIEHAVYTVGLIGIISIPSAHTKAIMGACAAWTGVCLFLADRVATARIHAGEQFNGEALSAWNQAVISQ